MSDELNIVVRMTENPYRPWCASITDDDSSCTGYGNDPGEALAHALQSPNTHAWLAERSLKTALETWISEATNT